MFAIFFNNISIFDYVKSKDYRISPNVYEYAKLMKKVHILEWMNKNSYLIVR